MHRKTNSKSLVGFLAILLALTILCQCSELQFTVEAPQNVRSFTIEEQSQISVTFWSSPSTGTRNIYIYKEGSNFFSQSEYQAHIVYQQNEDSMEPVELPTFEPGEYYLRINLKDVGAVSVNFNISISFEDSEDSFHSGSFINYQTEGQTYYPSVVEVSSSLISSTGYCRMDFNDFDGPESLLKVLAPGVEFSQAEYPQNQQGQIQVSQEETESIPFYLTEDGKWTFVFFTRLEYFTEIEEITFTLTSVLANQNLCSSSSSQDSSSDSSTNDNSSQNTSSDQNTTEFPFPQAVGYALGGVCAFLIAIGGGCLIYRAYKTNVNQNQETPTPGSNIRMQDYCECERDISGEICPVCLGPSCNSTLPCSHAFHHKCIQEWFQKQKDCPICRQASQKQDIRVHGPQAI